MAVKLTDEQFALLQEHFRKFPMTACPICAGRRWDSAGIHGAVPLQMTEDSATTAHDGPVLPVVAMVCTTCGFIREFAWLAVMGKATPESYSRG